MNDGSLLPVPKQLSFSSAWYTLPNDILQRLRAVVRSTEDAELSDILTAKRQVRLAPEAYELEIVPDGIVLRYGDPRGRLWGIRTLEQLVRGAAEPHEGSDAGRSIRCCSVRDEPDYPVRGVMLDVSRDRVPQMKTLFQLIELWSALKLNQLQLYTEHTFAYAGHERVWQHASPFTGEEIETIKRYCHERGMELVPNQNSVGHMERWLRHDAYKHLAECPDGFTDFGGVFRPASTCLSPAVPESLQLLGDLYDQLLPHFDTEMFNIGGDEPWELCRGRSARLCAERGHGQVYVDFLNEIHREVAKRGRRMQCFGDIITQYPGLISALPEDVVVLHWSYEADHPVERESELFASAGREFYLLSGTSSWNSIGGRWENAQLNISRMAEVGLENGAGGYIITDWGDNGHVQQLPVSYPGWAFAAAVSWGVARNKNIDIKRALARHLFGGSPEAAGHLADAVMALGNSYRQEPVRLHNGTVLAAALLPGLAPYYEADLSGCHGASFEPVKASLAEAQCALEKAGRALEPVQSDAGELRLIHRELSWSTAMLQLGADIAEKRYGEGSSAEPPGAETRWEALRREYIELWHARSRPGGLKESLSELDPLAR